jgi:hypothetical protein
MDGLPGMQRGVETAKKVDIKPIKKMVGAPAALLQNMRSRNNTPVSMSYLVLAVLSKLFNGNHRNIIGIIADGLSAILRLCLGVS